MKEYPKDWYKYLKKGDIVKCIACPNSNNLKYRSIGSELEITRNSNNNPIIYYKGINGSQDTSSNKLNEFIPIKMQTFPQLNIDAYEIY